MKTIKYISLVVITFCTCIFSACTEGNDWENGGDAYNRLKVPQISKVTPEKGALSVAFNTYGGTVYLLEANENPFPVVDEGEIMEGSVTAEVAKSPGIIEGLKGATEYYVRMRAVGDGKKASYWALYASYEAMTGEINVKQKPTETLLVDQILDEITDDDREANAITVRWMEGYTPTTIVASYKNGEEKIEKTYELSAGDVESRTFKCTDLNPSTLYEIRIFDGEEILGKREAKTMKAPPASDYTCIVEGDVIDQTVMNNAVAEAKKSGKEQVAVTFVIKAGKEVTVATESSSVSVPTNTSVYFFGEESSDGTQSKLIFPYQLKIDGNHAEIGFENLELTTSGGTPSDNRYIINQSAATSTGNVTFSTCYIHDVNASIVRLQGSGGSIGTITLSDCVVRNQGSNSYAVIYNQATSGGINEVVVENSTFDTCVNGIIANNSKNDTKFSKVTMTNCTIVNCIGSGKYIFDAGKNASSSVLETDVKMTHMIVGRPYNSSAKGYQSAGKLTLDHFYQTEGWKFSGGSFKSDDGGLKLDWRSGIYNDDALFENATEHDFTLKHWFEQTSADASKGIQFDIYGDPRWKVDEGGSGDDPDE